MNRLLRIGIVAALLALVPAFDSPASATSVASMSAVPNGQVLFGGAACTDGLAEGAGGPLLYDGSGERANFKDLQMVGSFDDGGATGADSVFAGTISMSAASVTLIPACVDDATCPGPPGCVDNPDSLVNAGVVLQTTPAFRSVVGTPGKCVIGGIGATNASSFLSVGVVALVKIDIPFDVQIDDGDDCDPANAFTGTTVHAIAVMGVAPLDTIEDNCETQTSQNCPTQDNPITDPNGDGTLEEFGDIVAGVIVGS